MLTNFWGKIFVSEVRSAENGEEKKKTTKYEDVRILRTKSEEKQVEKQVRYRKIEKNLPDFPN